MSQNDDSWLVRASPGRAGSRSPHQQQPSSSSGPSPSREVAAATTAAQPSTTAAHALAPHAPPPPPSDHDVASKADALLATGRWARTTDPRSGKTFYFDVANPVLRTWDIYSWMEHQIVMREAMESQPGSVNSTPLFPSNTDLAPAHPTGATSAAAAATTATPADSHQGNGGRGSRSCTRYTTLRRCSLLTSCSHATSAASRSCGAT
jgi:hypothetical protein